MDLHLIHTSEWHTTELGWEDSIKDKLLSSEDCYVWNQQYNPEQVIKKQGCTTDREWHKCLQVATSVICVNLCTAKLIWLLLTSYNFVPDPPNPPLCIKSVYFPIWSMQSHIWKMFAWHSWGICFWLPSIKVIWETVSTEWLCSSCKNKYTQTMIIIYNYKWKYYCLRK